MSSYTAYCLDCKLPLHLCEGHVGTACVEAPLSVDKDQRIAHLEAVEVSLAELVLVLSNENNRLTAAFVELHAEFDKVVDAEGKHATSGSPVERLRQLLEKLLPRDVSRPDELVTTLMSMFCGDSAKQPACSCGHAFESHVRYSVVGSCHYGEDLVCKCVCYAVMPTKPFGSTR